MNSSLKITNESKYELAICGDSAFLKIPIEDIQVGGINSETECTFTIYYPSNLSCLYYYHNFKFHLILKTDESFSKYKEITIKDSNIEGEVLVEKLERWEIMILFLFLLFN